MIRAQSPGKVGVVCDIDGCMGVFLTVEEYELKVGEKRKKKVRSVCSV